MSVSCEEGILDRSPKWEDSVAEKVELTDVLSSDGERVSPYYIFSVKLGTSGATETAGVVLDIKFVSNETALHAATYAPGSGSARRNTYLTGEGGTRLIVNGEAHQVVGGNIVVAAEGGNYTLSGVVTLDNEAQYDLSWGGALAFGDLPVMKKLTSVLAAQSNAAMGVKTVTVKLAESSEIYSEFDWTTFKEKYYGEGNFLAVDFYSEDGYLAAGTYRPCADAANPQPGEYVVGYDVADWNMFDYGTCWWTVKDGAATAEKISAGDITVDMADDKVYTVTIDNGEVFATFTGAIPALTRPGKPQGGDTPGSSVEEFPYLLSATEQYDQYKQVVLQIATDGVAYDAATYTYSGTGKILTLTINAAKDESGNIYIPTGEYSAADSTTEPFTWQITGGMPEWNFYWGTLMYDVKDGQASLVEFKEGTVWVGAKDGKYIINLESGDYKIRYTGAIQGLATPADDDGGYAGDEGAADDEVLEGDVVLKVTSGLTYTKTDDTANNTTADGAALSDVTLWYVEVKDASGNAVAIFDLVTAAGAESLAGEYTVTSYPDAAGEAGNGFDMRSFGWDVYGGCILNDGETSYPLDDGSGTVSVTEDGDKLTIRVNATTSQKTIAAKYVIG